MSDKLFTLKNPSNEDLRESHESILNLAKESTRFGVAFARDGKIAKFSGKKLAGVEDFVRLFSGSTGIIISAEKFDLSAHQTQPCVIGDDIAFASCGDVVSTENKELRPAQIFCRKYLTPSCASSPRLMFNPAFRTLISMVSRPHIVLVYMSADGEITVSDESAFSLEKGGVLMTDESINLNRSKNKKRSFSTQNAGFDLVLL